MFWIGSELKFRHRAVDSIQEIEDELARNSSIAIEFHHPQVK